MGGASCFLGLGGGGPFDGQIFLLGSVLLCLGGGGEISHNNIMSEFQINIIYIITYYIKKNIIRLAVPPSFWFSSVCSPGCVFCGVYICC